MHFENTKDMFMHLGAFWQSLWIYKRKCDYSWKDIVSPFSKDCPYPVWHRDIWFEKTQRDYSTYDKQKDFWQQVWDLFKKCPIAHNIWNGSENSSYTDDCWFSKNIYLSHSLAWCEDSSYLYRTIRLKDCQFCVFSFDSEKCIDLIYWHNCYNIKYAIDVKRCKNSAFLFDCEDCENCMLCWNLRNKKYYIANKKYKKEDYEEEIKKYNLKSRKIYNQLKSQFINYIENNAWWKQLHVENTEESYWNYLESSKNCKNCYYINGGEDCENVARWAFIKSSKNAISPFDWEKIYNSVLVQDKCYNINYSSNISRSRNIEYSINCFDCEDCFLCASLIWKKYHILNKKYKKEDYEKQKEEIIKDMKEKWVYGEFFPGYFSPTNYEGSLSWIYYPISKEEQKEKWFRVSITNFWDWKEFKSLSELPDDISSLDENDYIWWYWDEESKRPFQISKLDIDFSKKLWVALNDRFYIRRLKENFKYMFPCFELRKTKCAISWKEIQTTLPEFLDNRIVSLEEYNKIVY